MSTTLDEINNQTVGDGWEDYEPQRNTVIPPPPEVYTFARTPGDNDEFKTRKADPITGRTSDGPDAVDILQFNFRAEIQGGKHDKRSTFVMIDTGTNQYKKFSTVQDYVAAATKYKEKAPRAADLVAEFKRTGTSPTLAKIVGPFQAVTKWEWFCKPCNRTILTGYATSAKSPKNYDGPKVTVAKIGKDVDPTQTCPRCSSKITANLKVDKILAPETKTITLPPTTAGTIGISEG